MPSDEDILFAKIAIKNKLATEGQVNKCFDVQKKLAKLGKEKSVLEILKEIGFLRENHLRKIRDASQKSQKLQDSLAIGDFAVASGMISQEVFDQCMETVKKEKHKRPLVEILLSQGHINPKNYDILKIRGKAESQNETVVAPEINQGETHIDRPALPKIDHKGATQKEPSLKKIPHKQPLQPRVAVTTAGFDMSSYIEQKQKKDRTWKFVVVGIFSIVILIVLTVAYMAYQDRSNYSKAKNLATAEQYGAALKKLDHIRGGFWINGKEVIKLKSDILFKQDVSKALKFLRNQQFQEAKKLLGKLAKKYPANGEEIDQYLYQIDFERCLARARQAWREEKYQGAFLLYQQAKNLKVDPVRVEEQIKKFRLFLSGKAQRALENKEYSTGLVLFLQLKKIFHLSMHKEIQRCYFQKCFQWAKREFARDQPNWKALEDQLNVARQKGGNLAQQKAFRQLMRSVKKKKRYLTLLARIEKAKKDEIKRELLLRAAKYAPSRDRKDLLGRARRIEEDLRRKKSLQKYLAKMVQAVAVLKKSQIQECRKILQSANQLAPSQEEGKQLLTFVKKLNRMIYIPPGPFWQGSSLQGEDPGHKVNLSAYFIDAYEVTNDDFKKFYLQQGYSKMKYWPGAHHLLAKFTDGDGNAGPGKWKSGRFPLSKQNLPVVLVSWYEARAYALLMGKQLPTESQWEKAARGPYSPSKNPPGRIYPWGWKFHFGRANVGRVYGSTEKVGATSGDKSYYKIYDLAGNVREWTKEVFHPYKNTSFQDYRYSGKNYRTVKGGGWQTPPSRIKKISRASYRDGLLPDQRLENVGFRCVLEIPSDIWNIFLKYEK